MSKSHNRERANRWFQPAEGIAREVITADIQRYLGRDALVRPGAHEGQEGYWITAYRNLTTEMVHDLRQDSQRWRVEQQGYTSRGALSYNNSMTHHDRQQAGPTQTPAPAMESAYPVPDSSHYQQRDMYGAPAVRNPTGYAVQGHAAYPQSMVYMQPAGTYEQVPQAYVDPSFSSPQGAYAQASVAHTAAPVNYSVPAANYQEVSPGYGGQQGGTQYVTSTTPQSYDGNQQPRTVGNYEGFPPPDSRAPAADAYYRTGQAAPAPQGYAYQTGVTANSSRENVYQVSQAQAMPASASNAGPYYDQYTGRMVQPTAEPSNKRRHESNSHAHSGSHGSGGHSSSHRRR